MGIFALTYVVTWDAMHNRVHGFSNFKNGFQCIFGKEKNLKRPNRVELLDVYHSARQVR